MPEKEKDKDKKPAVTSSKPKAEHPEAQPVVEKPKEISDVEPVVNHITTTTTAAAVEANSPQSDANATKDNEVKNVPKTIDDGAKRVNAKPKWNRFDVEPKSSSAASSQNRRKTERSPPRRNNRDDYYSRRDDRVRDDRDDRSSRRGNSSRGSVPSSSSRNPRSGVAPPPAAATAVTAAAVVVPPSSTTSSVKSTTAAAPTRGPRREPAYITRSNRPSYTESKTPGLNGNPLVPMKSSDPYDAKKHKPLIGRPILIDTSAIAPMVTAQNIFGTYYFNGPAPYALDAIGGIKESIKKQM